MENNTILWKKSWNIMEFERGIFVIHLNLLWETTQGYWRAAFYRTAQAYFPKADLNMLKDLRLEGLLFLCFRRGQSLICR